MRRARVLAAIGSAAALGLTTWGGVAVAAIPNSGTGVYTMCMPNTGTLRTALFIDKQSGGTCPANYTEKTFNQTGPVGPAGAAGATGAAGAKGDKGDAGSTGPAGATGATGPAGAKGDTGSAGASGSVGPVGPAGADGAKGDTGATGPAGASGGSYYVNPAPHNGVGHDGLNTQEVACDPGDIATGGGGITDGPASQAYLVLVDSFPVYSGHDAPTWWGVTYHNTDTQDPHFFTSYVVCLHQS